MRTVINDHDIEIPYMADDLISRKCHKLERMLNKYQSDEVTLQCDLDRASGKKAFQVKLNLKMPYASLNVTEVDKSIVKAFGSAFIKLFRSVSELKTTLRATQDQKIKRDAAERSLSDTVLPEVARSLLADFFSSNYGQLYNYALREIRFRSYQGHTKPGTIDVSDVLNEALLKVGGQLSLDFNEEKAKRLFFNEMRMAIERQLGPGGVALVPIEEPIEPEDIDSEYQEYYQPDEVIKVEDILIDPDTILPEQEVIYKEIETHIDKLLSQLPTDWRNAFILFVREDIPVSDIARNSGKTIEEIQRNIDNARSFIRRKLQDTGFEWKE